MAAISRRGVVSSSLMNALRFRLGGGGEPSVFFVRNPVAKRPPPDLLSSELEIGADGNGLEFNSDSS